MMMLLAEFWRVVILGGPLMIVLFLLAACLYWLAIDTLRTLHGKQLSEAELAISLNGEQARQLFELDQLQFYRDRKSLLDILVTTAPLLGLLGTVMGMLATFQGLNASDGNTIDLIAAGISEAMITTETGLIIAIPGSFIVMAITSRLQAIENFLQRARLGELDQSADPDSQKIVVHGNA